MNGPKIKNLGKPTPSKLRFWANLVLVLATAASGILWIAEHPIWGAVVTLTAAGSRFVVEFYSEEGE